MDGIQEWSSSLPFSFSTLRRSNPLYHDLKQIKQIVKNINPEIITLKLEWHGIQEWSSTLRRNNPLYHDLKEIKQIVKNINP